MTTLKIAGLLAAALVVAGCDRASQETAPVEVTSAMGTITCQLYSADIVLWDEATSYPAGMTQDAADAACKAEGRRLRAES